MSVGSTTTAHACPCCGHRTLTAPSPSWLTCPVCYWTDTPIETGGDENALFLAQRSFLLSGASDPSYLDRVRGPLPGEARAVDWRPCAGVDDPRTPPRRDRAAALLIGRIERAFDGVAPDGRTTLREAYRADYYGNEPDDLDWRDQDTRWTQIPLDVLEYIARRTSVFNFGNTESFRYYLPAYMRYSLRRDDAMPTKYALDLPLPPGVAPTSLERVAALTAEQREVVVAYLRFLLDFDGPDETAQRALDRIWLPSLAS